MRLITLFETNLYSLSFRKWFGSSVVVTDDGEPKIVYHGTADDFSSFAGMVWASEDPDLPWDYAEMRQQQTHNRSGANIIPLYMRMERPFDADHLPMVITISEFVNELISQSAVLIDNLHDEIRNLWDILLDSAAEESSGPRFDRFDFWNEVYLHFGPRGAAAIESLFRLLNFDGIIMTEGGNMTYGVFWSGQVKSVFNKGNYDINSGSISECI